MVDEMADLHTYSASAIPEPFLVLLHPPDSMEVRVACPTRQDYADVGIIHRALTDPKEAADIQSDDEDDGEKED